MKNSNIGNLISNYVSKLWSLISVFIFIPFYIKYLGVESFAVIGFYTLILGVISFADAGMSSAVIREFSSGKKAIIKYSFLILIERIYISICFFITIVIIIFSKLIANNWLKSETIPIDDLVFYIQLIGIGVPIQLLSSLYFGALFGLNNQIRANYIQIIWNVFKSGIVIVFFIFFGSSLKLFFLWQIGCNFIYVLTLRYNTIYLLKKNAQELVLVFNKIPQDILKYIGSMTLVAIISSINIQADKIITSSYFDLKIFGYYTIASTLAQLPVIMASPLVMSVFPLFSKFCEAEKQTFFNISFQKASFLLSIVVFPVTIILFLYSPEIILLWTGYAIEKVWLTQIHLVIKFLVVGSLFLALQLIPFYVLLSKGRTKYTVYQGIVQVLLGVPLLFFFVSKLGLIGAGIPWVVINFGALLYLYSVVFKYLDGINVFLFLKKNILYPLIISVIVIYLFYFIYIQFKLSFYYYVILSGLISIIINVCVFNYMSNCSFFNIKTIFNFSNE